MSGVGLPQYLVVAAILCGAAQARAEVIELVDKTKMNAKIVHFYDGVYTVEYYSTDNLSNAETMHTVTIKVDTASRLKALVDIGLPRPRSDATRALPEFQALTQHIWSLIRDEAYRATVA